MCYGNSTFGGGIKLIEVKNVTKKYGNFLAVNNISFTVNDGEVVGFLGPNGAGKSTTMNMITGFIEPTDGTIIVNGEETDTITSQMMGGGDPMNQGNGMNRGFNRR